MDDDLKALCKRLEAVRYQREDWHEPYGAFDLPCDADDHGAVAVPRNPDGPEAAKAIRTLLSERRKMVEALRRVRDLDTRSHHDGYDNGPGGGFYIYRDVIFADEAFPIIDAALTGSREHG